MGLDIETAQLFRAAAARVCCQRGIEVPDCYPTECDPKDGDGLCAGCSVLLYCQPVSNALRPEERRAARLAVWTRQLSQPGRAAS